jgi:hypothetical protein
MISSQLLNPDSVWERLRNPMSGWTRVALGLALPFIIWTHNPLLIILMTLAILSHPFWFPPAKKDADPNDFMVRSIDSTREWMRVATLYEKSVIYYASAVMFGGSVALLWVHHWMGALLYICLIGFKIIALAWITERTQSDYVEIEVPRTGVQVFEDDDN